MHYVKVNRDTEDSALNAFQETVIFYTLDF